MRLFLSTSSAKPTRMVAFGLEEICNMLVVAGVTMSSDLVRDLMAKLPPPRITGQFTMLKISPWRHFGPPYVTLN